MAFAQQEVEQQVEALVWAVYLHLAHQHQAAEYC
jgi:hypothetical protein